MSMTKSIFGRTLGLASTAFAGLYATSAAAFFDVQVLAGKRWYDWEGAEGKSGVASQEIDVAAHLDPIPLVPVGFGASVALGSLRKGDFGEPNPSEASTFEAGLDIMAWLPMVPVVTPYARFKYPVVGTAMIKGTGYEITNKLSGYHLNIGLKYAPLPVVKVLVETGLGMQTYKADEVKINGVKATPDNTEYDANSKTFLVGIEIGL